MAFSYNSILKIPERSILDRKLTKAFFLKNFELSAAEKKVLNSAIDSMNWLASIKPANANIPAVVSDVYSYEEIQVIVVTVLPNRLNESAEKCVALLQKYIPYQMILIVEDDTDFIINVCDKRINLSDAGKRTIEKYFTTPALSKLFRTDLSKQFYEFLDFAKLDKANLDTTYKSYIRAVVQFQTAMVTGTFLKRSARRTETDMNLLASIEILEKEIVRLTNQLKKETQLNNRVTLNINIQNQRAEVEYIKKQLSTP